MSPVQSPRLLHDSGRYFDALGTYRSGDVVPIASVIDEVSFVAVHNGRILVDDLETVQREWRDRVKARRDSAAHRLVSILLR